MARAIDHQVNATASMFVSTPNEIDMRAVLQCERSAP